MTGKERILAKLGGEPTDSLPLMPITMMFAADLAGVRYVDYARDHRVLADAQVAVQRGPLFAARTFETQAYADIGAVVFRSAWEPGTGAQSNGRPSGPSVRSSGESYSSPRWNRPLSKADSAFHQRFEGLEVFAVRAPHRGLHEGGDERGEPGRFATVP